MANVSALSKGDRVRFQVEEITPGGIAVARLGGLSFEVLYADVGERVEAEVKWVDGSTVECRLLEVHEASEHRTTPTCKHFGACGGCKLQHLTYQRQLEHKRGWIRKALAEQAGLVWNQIFVHQSEPYGYRLKAALKGRRTLAGRLVGYCQHKSFTLLPITECPILAPELQTLVTEFAVNPPEFPRRTADVMIMLGLDGIAIHVPGGRAPETKVQVRHFTYSMNVRNFFQINRFLIPSMVDEAINGDGGERAIDLYCGVGLYSLFLAQRYERVIGVEANGASVKYAILNAQNAALENATFYANEVEALPEQALALCRKADLLVVNPPRSGMSAAARLRLLELEPQRLHYISCNPVTMASDVGFFITHGYSVNRVAMLDMFPQTGHVETVVHVSKEQR